MYIHYKHVREFNVTDMPIILKLNYWSLWIGAFTCLGLSIVANFQVSLTYAFIECVHVTSSNSQIQN